MAFNFAETFLRESGAAQDRSRSMAEMKLNAQQFASDLAFRQAQLQLSKEVQAFNEEEAIFQRRQQFLDRAQQNEQFRQKIQLERDALNQRKDISDADRAAEMKRLDAQVSQWEAQNNIAWANLDQNGKQMMLDYEIKVEELGIKKELAEANIKQTEATTASIIGQERRDEKMAPLKETLTNRQIQSLAIANSLESIRLARQTRGEAYLTEQASEETKRLLGVGSDEELTNERAANLLQTRMLEEGLQEKQLTRQAATAQQIYAERPQKSLEEAVDSVKSGRFSALDTKSGFGRYAWNPAMNAISTALFGPSSIYSENTILRNLETATGVKRKPLIEAMMEKSSQGSIVSGMPQDIRNIYLPQSELNILRSNSDQTNVNASTLLGPNYPMYGADYTNYIQMMMPQQENVMPEE